MRPNIRRRLSSDTVAPAITCRAHAHVYFIANMQDGADCIEPDLVMTKDSNAGRAAHENRSAAPRRCRRSSGICCPARHQDDRRSFHHPVGLPKISRSRSSRPCARVSAFLTFVRVTRASANRFEDSDTGGDSVAGARRRGAARYTPRQLGLPAPRHVGVYPETKPAVRPVSACRWSEAGEHVGRSRL